MSVHRSKVLTPAESVMDFAGWISEEMVVYQKAGHEWVCDCPRCDRAKLAVNVTRKVYQCWFCGFAGWSPTTLVQAVCGLRSPIAAAKIVAQWGTGRGDLGARIRPLDDAQAAGSLDRLLPPAPAPPGTLWRLHGAEEHYALTTRRIPAEHAAWFGLSSVLGDGRSTKVGRMTEHRLLLPVWDERGTFVYWTAREVVGDGKMKTVNLPSSCSFPDDHAADCVCKHTDWGLSPVPAVAGKAEVLLGMHLVKPGDWVNLVEGPIDAAVCGPGFVSTLGASVSLMQALLLVQRRVAGVTLLYDPDAAGERGAQKAHVLLSQFLDTRVAECPVGEDPAVLGRARALEVCSRSVRTPGRIVALGEPTYRRSDAGPRPPRPLGPLD